MAATPDTCVACHKPFRENRELAAAPRGRRFAFEAASGRVWRICRHCSHWNLMGPEAAQAALPELEARFQASAVVGAPAIALSRSLALTAILLALLNPPAMAQQPASLIRNGGSEEGPGTRAYLNLPGGSTALPGWVVTGEGIDLVGAGYWRSSKGTSRSRSGHPSAGLVTAMWADASGAQVTQGQ